MKKKKMSITGNIIEVFEEMGGMTKEDKMISRVVDNVHHTESKK